MWQGSNRFSPAPTARAARRRSPRRRAINAAIRYGVAVACLFCFAMPVSAERYAPPGDLLLRDDLQVLNDTGAANIPLTTWPLAWDDIHEALAATRFESLDPVARSAAERVWARMSEAGSSNRS